MEITYQNFKTFDKIIKVPTDLVIKKFLEESLEHLIEELDLFCTKNSNYDFVEWFSESGLLSMFINGIIRNDGENRNISVVQEYCVKNHIKGGTGRCDAFITFDKNVILIEAKKIPFIRKVDEDHFKIEPWLKWDNDVIKNQLENYLLSEKNFFLKEGRYNNCYLMTIVFKILKEDPVLHREKALKELNLNGNKSLHQWYYSLCFLNPNETGSPNGIEIYGTIEKFKQQNE